VILVWGLLLGLLAILGLGLIRTQQGPVNVGATVPDFTLTTFDGQKWQTRGVTHYVPPASRTPATPPPAAAGKAPPR